jgi:uncharacterized membrane protein YsdA (DUF1294 family)
MAQQNALAIQLPSQDISFKIAKLIQQLRFSMIDTQAFGDLFAANGIWFAVAFYGLTNCICLILYGWDKAAAYRHAPRISERTLLLWTLLAGGAIALLAQKLFRHKTQKTRFQIVAIFALTLHTGLILLWCWDFQ